MTLVFFITYVVFQPLSTGLVRKIGPRLHLAAITVFWGATMIGMGFAPTWNALAGLRALLGIFEVSIPRSYGNRIMLKTVGWILP